jgi:hypothetical protein
LLINAIMMIMVQLQLRLDPVPAAMLARSLAAHARYSRLPEERQQAALMLARLEYRALRLWGVTLRPELAEQPATAAAPPAPRRRRTSAGGQG